MDHRPLVPSCLALSTPTPSKPAYTASTNSLILCCWILGIKVDTGVKDMAGHPGKKKTEGLDGLGARFAKWRGVITIADGIPSRGCIEARAHALARYAALCQEAGVFPIVEPEVFMDGEHPLES